MQIEFGYKMEQPKIDQQEKIERIRKVIDEYGGMIPQFEVFYLLSILYPAERCLEAFSRYEEIKTYGKPELVIGIVQEAIGHAAALSRFFWPSEIKKKKEERINELMKLRGEKLRTAFHITEESPLSNRNLRNAWEHFDERLDEYLLENDVGFFFPGCIKGSCMSVEDSLARVFKLIDIETNCLILLGQKYFFLPIWNEVREIHNSTVGKIEAGLHLSI
jgi:hypothetical protein